VWLSARSGISGSPSANLKFITLAIPPLCALSVQFTLGGPNIDALSAIVHDFFNSSRLTGKSSITPR
jgi:hypothetical protein